MYRLELDEDALDDLGKIDRLQARRILDKMEWVAEHAEQLGGNHTPVVNWPGLYRRRVGDYRVYYRLYAEQHCLAVFGVDTKPKAYRRSKLKRLWERSEDRLDTAP